MAMFKWGREDKDVFSCPCQAPREWNSASNEAKSRKRCSPGSSHVKESVDILLEKEYMKAWMDRRICTVTFLDGQSF
jgi:hypothetical protein